VGAALAILALCAAVPAGADTKTDLQAARAKLQRLEAQITSQEARVDHLQADLRSIALREGRAEIDLADIRRRERLTEARLTATRERRDALRGRIADRARTTYMHGTGLLQWIDLLSAARSITDLNARVAYVSRVVRRDADVVLQMRRVAAELEVQQNEQERLVAARAGALREVRSQQRALQNTFAAQQSALASLASARGEINRLVDTLKDKLRAEELAAARRVAGRGMPITFGQWAQTFLRAVPAPGTRENLVAVVAWETAEYTRATWNPLATTYAMPGSTVYNSSGVRNYTSQEQGIQATIATLHRPNHGYEAILSALAQGGDAMATAQAINASDWCRGCTNGAYVVSLIPTVRAYYDRYAG
jgi:peptidoglycan hydrolase CwlO-like protein